MTDFVISCHEIFQEAINLRTIYFFYALILLRYMLLIRQNFSVVLYSWLLRSVSNNYPNRENSFSWLGLKSTERLKMISECTKGWNQGRQQCLFSLYTGLSLPLPLPKLPVTAKTWQGPIISKNSILLCKFRLFCLLFNRKIAKYFESISLNGYLGRHV